MENQIKAPSGSVMSTIEGMNIMEAQKATLLHGNSAVVDVHDPDMPQKSSRMVMQVDLQSGGLQMETYAFAKLTVADALRDGITGTRYPDKAAYEMADELLRGDIIQLKNTLNPQQPLTIAFDLNAKNGQFVSLYNSEADKVIDQRKGRFDDRMVELYGNRMDTPKAEEERSQGFKR